MDSRSAATLRAIDRPILSKTLLRHVKWEYFAAGISGGVVSTLVLHPLDLVKIRFQVNEGIGLAQATRPQYNGVVHALRSIFTTSGITGLYQGVTPNVWGAGASWGLYFFFYNSIKMWMQDGDSKKALGWTKHLACASEAGLVTLILTNPIWVTKTRLCLQYGRGTGPTSGGVFYKGTIDALFKIYKMEGIRGLYKGFVPGVFGISHGAVQFMTYEEMKNYYNRIQHRPIDTRLNSAEYLTFAALSKIVAALTTYPYQVLRARLQDQHRSYSGVKDVTAQIIKSTVKVQTVWIQIRTDIVSKLFAKIISGPQKSLLATKEFRAVSLLCCILTLYEGAKGFYKGLVPNLLRVTPACCITFVVYEYLITKLLHGEKNGSINSNSNGGQTETEDS